MIKEKKGGSFVPTYKVSDEDPASVDSVFLILLQQCFWNMFIVSYFQESEEWINNILKYDS